MHRYSDPTAISRAAIGLMLIFCITVGLSMVLIVWQIENFRAYMEVVGGPGEIEVTESIEDLADIQDTLGTVIIGVGIVSGLVFLRWTYAIGRNAHALAAGVETSPGLGVGWYFVPFANLFKPYTALNEFVAASRPAGRNESVLSGWWWTLHLLAVIGDRVVAVVVKSLVDAGELEKLILANQYLLVATGLVLALNVVAALMVQRIGNLQVQKALSDEVHGAVDCPGCGERIPPGDTNCLVCGHRITRHPLELPQTFSGDDPLARDEADDPFDFDR